jgi:hypothetical protein
MNSIKKTMTQKQIDANRRNAKKSTGPRTSAGRAASKMNALKHAILSREVIIHSRCLQESEAEFDALHQRLWDDYNPVGAVEEMLVDQILTSHWRLRRAHKAESGEIVLSVDGGNWSRIFRGPLPGIEHWGNEGKEGKAGDLHHSMKTSVLGNTIMEFHLTEIRASVEEAGELTEYAIHAVIGAGRPPSDTCRYKLRRDLEKLHSRLQENPEGLEPSALRAKQKKQALAGIDEMLRSVYLAKSACEMLEEAEEAAKQAAAVLPPPEILDKILRYETKLERQMYRAMNQLERLQRMRQGGVVPPPLSIEVSATN